VHAFMGWHGHQGEDNGTCGDRAHDENDEQEELPTERLRGLDAWECDGQRLPPANRRELYAGVGIGVFWCLELG
jgi:hypothetical protein